MNNFTSNVPNRIDKFEVPLLHKIVELYKLFHKCLILFPKHEKYTIGQKTENTILEVLELILSASYAGIYKKEILRKTNNKTDLLKYLIRIAYETNSIRIKNYLSLEEEILNIGRMIGGWQRSLK
ncbi:MAG TPA: four helix bundle protein [Candidatus Paceibacterota bacterium]|nr:four helix bundle protein [Candidatus Paceibacterota bacterium]